MSTTTAEHDPTFWMFHKMMRAKATPYDVFGHSVDHTIARIWADQLEDHDDWRSELLRNTANIDSTHYWAATSQPLELTHRDGDKAVMNRYALQDSVKHDAEGKDYSKGHTNFFPANRPETGEARYVAYTTIPHPVYQLTADPVRFYSVHTPESMARMAAANPRVAEVKAAIDAGRRHPVKLARNAVVRFWDKLTGRGQPDEWHPHYDGIVHTGGGAAGYPKAFAERSAVSRALHSMGGGWGTAETINRYTRLASRFVKLFPEHPLSKHYVAKASQINAPGDVGDSGKYATVPTTGPVGAELGAAVTPLVRFLNRIEARQGRDTVRAPQLPEVHTVRHDDAGDTRAAAEEGEHMPLPARYTDTADLPPIPLHNYPGEIGSTGDRWGDLDVLHRDGLSKVQLMKHLMERYALSPRLAAGTLRRWAAKKSMKLARPEEGVSPDEAVFLAALHTNRNDKTVRLVYSDWLEDHDRLVAAAAHRKAAEQLDELNGLRHDRIVTYPRGSWRWQDAFGVVRYEPRLKKNGKWLWTPVKVLRGKSSMPQLRAAGWGDTQPGSANNRPINRDLARFGPEHVAYYHPELFAEGKTRLARKPHLPEVPTPTEKQVRTVGPTDKDWLAGTQLAYHLRSLVNEGLVNRDHPLVQAARRALGYRSMKADPANGTKGAMRSDLPILNHYESPIKKGSLPYTGPEAYAKPSIDPFADLGALLKARGHKLASAYNWHTMEESVGRDRAVESALRKLLTGARDDHHLFTGAAKMFDLKTGMAKDPRFAEFWKRMPKLVRESPHLLAGSASVGKINDSLKRLADREEFRREVGEEKGTGHGATTWQKIFSWLPGSKYMKFDRRDKLDLIRLSRTNATIRECLGRLTHADPAS